MRSTFFTSTPLQYFQTPHERVNQYTYSFISLVSQIGNRNPMSVCLPSYNLQILKSFRTTFILYLANSIGYVLFFTGMVQSGLFCVAFHPWVVSFMGKTSERSSLKATQKLHLPRQNYNTSAATEVQYNLSFSGVQKGGRGNLEDKSETLETQTEKDLFICSTHEAITSRVEAKGGEEMEREWAEQKGTEGKETHGRKETRER